MPFGVSSAGWEPNCKLKMKISRYKDIAGKKQQHENDGLKTEFKKAKKKRLTFPICELIWYFSGW